jgi:hypothetical protein
MTIQAAQTVDVIVLSTDTTLINPTDGRILITNCTMHEQTGNAETVEIFSSADATSAAAERIDNLSFSASETKYQNALNGKAVDSGAYLIGKATTGNRVMVSITYTQFSGSS